MKQAPESELLTQERCHAVFEHVLAAARARGVQDVEVTLAAERFALTRFAANAVHQNVAERSHALSVRPVIDGRTARVSTNRFDAGAIAALVDEAIAACGASSMKDMGQVMAALRPNVQGRADMGAVSALVKARLG